MPVVRLSPLPARAAMLFLFLDGVGLGAAGPHNPLSTLPLAALERLAGGAWTDALAPIAAPGHVVRAIDATLGVDGLPQSGTGQAALFTGRNAARLHGAHYGPTPPTTVRDTVREHSVFAQLRDAGVGELAFANAYPDRFFDLVEPRGRWTCTTLAARAAGVPLRRAADLLAGRALAADLTGATWQRLFTPGLDVVTPAAAGRRLAEIARRHRFTLFEFFLTDKAGHSRDPERAAAVLRDLDALVGGVREALGDRLLVVTSDHGNLEDLSTKSHTRNPVPLIAVGPGADAFAEATSLTDVTPAVVGAVSRV